MISTVIVGILTVIAQALPGFLAAFSNHATDAEAIATAQKAIDAIPAHPAADALSAWRAHLASIRAITPSPQQQAAQTLRVALAAPEAALLPAAVVSAAQVLADHHDPQ